jgi:hypothetical protein
MEKTLKSLSIAVSWVRIPLFPPNLVKSRNFEKTKSISTEELMIRRLTKLGYTIVRSPESQKKQHLLNHLTRYLYFLLSVPGIVMLS